MSCRAGFVWETPQHFVRVYRRVRCTLRAGNTLYACRPVFPRLVHLPYHPHRLCKPGYCRRFRHSGFSRTVYADLWKMVATFSSLGQSWIKRTHTTGCRSPLPTGTSSSPGMLPAGIQHLHKHLSQTTILLTSNVTARFLHMAGLLPEIPAALPLL